MRALKRALRIALRRQVNAIGMLRLRDELNHEPTVGEKLQILILVEVCGIIVLPIEELGPAVEAGFEVGLG